MVVHFGVKKSHFVVETMLFKICYCPQATYRHCINAAMHISLVALGVAARTPGAGAEQTFAYRFGGGGRLGLPED